MRPFATSRFCQLYSSIGCVTSASQKSDESHEPCSVLWCAITRALVRDCQPGCATLLRRHQFANDATFRGIGYREATIRLFEFRVCIVPLQAKYSASLPGWRPYRTKACQGQLMKVIINTSTSQVNGHTYLLALGMPVWLISVALVCTSDHKRWGFQNPMLTKPVPRYYTTLSSWPDS